MGIKQYDTVKDKNGDRFRVVEVGSDGKGHVIAKLKGITPDNRAKRGPARLVEASVLEEKYTRIDLPEVTVIKPASRPAENAMQKQREIVGEYAKKHVNVINELDEDDIIMKGMEEEIEKLKQANADLRRINEEWAGGKKEDLEVFKAECIDLKEENRQLKDSNVQTNNQLRVRDQETIDLKKTISKMKDAHDEEVRALEDEIMELKILAKKSGQYSDALDDDSIVFGKIYTLSDAMLDLAASMMKMAKSIKDETEERI